MQLQRLTLTHQNTKLLHMFMKLLKLGNLKLLNSLKLRSGHGRVWGHAPGLLTFPIQWNYSTFDTASSPWNAHSFSWIDYECNMIGRRISAYATKLAQGEEYLNPQRLKTFL